jgi:hypothetical protein
MLPGYIRLLPVSAASGTSGLASYTQAAPVCAVAGVGAIIMVAFQDSSFGGIIPMVASGSGGLTNQNGVQIPFLEAGTGYYNVSTEYGFHVLYVPRFPPGTTSVIAQLSHTATGTMGMGIAPYLGLTAALAIDAFASNPAQSAANTTQDTVTSTTCTPTGAAPNGALCWGCSFSFSAFEVPSVGTGFGNTATWIIPPEGLIEDKLITSNAAVAATFKATTTGHIYTSYVVVIDLAPPSAGLTRNQRWPGRSPGKGPLSARFFQPLRDTTYTPVAPPSGILAGTAAITFGQSGLLAARGALAGSAAITFGESGLLTARGALAGTAAITFGQSGLLAARGALAGSAAITFGQTGLLAARGALAGTAAVTFGQSGLLTARGALAGEADITFGASATASQPGALAGTAAITIGGSGLLTARGALAGTAAITFAAYGTVPPPVTEQKIGGAGTSPRQGQAYPKPPRGYTEGRYPAVIGGRLVATEGADGVRGSLLPGLLGELLAQESGEDELSGRLGVSVNAALALLEDADIATGACALVLGAGGDALEAPDACEGAASVDWRQAESEIIELLAD